MLGRPAWVAAYRAELQRAHAWAGDLARLGTYLAGVEITIDGGDLWTCDPDAPALAASWRAVGGAGRPTLAALRRAYGTAPVVAPSSRAARTRTPRPPSQRGVTAVAVRTSGPPWRQELVVYRAPVVAYPRVLDAAPPLDAAGVEIVAVAPRPAGSRERWHATRALLLEHATAAWPAYHASPGLAALVVLADLATSTADAGAYLTPEALARAGVILASSTAARLRPRGAEALARAGVILRHLGLAGEGVALPDASLALTDVDLACWPARRRRPAAAAA